MKSKQCFKITNNNALKLRTIILNASSEFRHHTINMYSMKIDIDFQIC